MMLEDLGNLRLPKSDEPTVIQNDFKEIIRVS